MPANKMRSKRNVPHHVSDVFAQDAQLPQDEDLRQAADILNSGKRIEILAGAGALGAGDQVEAVADKLAGPIIKPLLGKAVVPDYSPFTTCGIGLLGTKPSEDAIANCDTLFMIGASFPYIEFLPKPGQARCVQVDIDALVIVGIGIAGAVAATIASRKT
jgi:pyruvate dehydrogenase (quinone)/pyruvate oxidase